MKGSTIAIIVLGVGLLGAGAYFVLKPAGPQKPNAPAQPSGPTGFAQGGNSTLNTVSQAVGVAQQAAGIFGSISSAVSNIES